MKKISAIGILLSRPALVFILFVFAERQVQAQAKAQFTQYMFNGLILNPAYAGSDEALSLTFLNRSQWGAVPGAPVTQTLSAHTLVHKKRLGLGIYFMNDKIGAHKNQDLMGSVAYHLQVSTKATLSMGIQAGLNVRKSDYSSLMSNQTPDPRLQNSNFSQTYLNLGLGVFYRSPKWTVGLSVPQLMPERFTEDTLSITWQKANYLLFSKYHIDLTSSLALEPVILFKYHAGSPLSYDINACLIIKKVLTMGLSYRKNESVDFLLKAQLTPQLQFGYSYDYGIGQFARDSGSHEIMINYVFRFTQDAIVSPR